jgi:hypothetical protein
MGVLSVSTKGLKGITVWIWIIAGLIVGLILFTIFVQFISYIMRAREVESAKSTFQELANDARNICQTIAGAGSSKLEKTYVFPDAVSDVYSVTSVSKSAEIQSEARSYGRYLCMKIYEESVCENIQCDVEMSNIKNIPSLTTTINKILGTIGTKEYKLDITKAFCGVSVLKYGEVPTDFCGEKCSEVVSLMGCQNHNTVSIISNNTLVMTDFTPISDCCSNYPNALTFLKNVAKYFGGSKILVVWESNFTNPANERYAVINDALRTSGFEIISFRHKEKLTAEELDGKDQVWIYLPGWCSEQPEVQRTVECTEFVKWDQSEYDAIRNFVNSDGKLFIVTDYSPYTKQTIVNNILNNFGQSAKVLETNVCGSQGNIFKTSNITSSQITQGISEFSFLATSEIVC